MRAKYAVKVLKMQNEAINGPALEYLSEALIKNKRLKGTESAMSKHVRRSGEEIQMVSV
jgi:hypothetical protein